MENNLDKGIKTREVRRDIRILDRAEDLGKKMKSVTAWTGDRVKDLTDDGIVTPEEYAESGVRRAAEDTASRAGRRVKKTLSGTRKRIEDRIRKRMRESRDTDTGAGRGAQPSGGRTAHARRVHVIKQRDAATRVVRQKQKTVKTADTYARSAGRTSRAAVRSARMTAKTTERTARAAAKAAKKAAQVSAKAAKAAAVQAKKASVAAYKAAVVIGKAVVAAVKAMIAAIKELAAVIAAGGWVSAVVIAVVCVCGLMVSSAFGIFLSGEDTGSGMTMREAVSRINSDYLAELDGIKAGCAYDELEMSGSCAVWREVLAVYAVKTSGDAEEPQEVATVDEEKLELLRNVFNEMNRVTSWTETETVTVIIESDDGHGNVVETETEEELTTLYISVSHLTAGEAAELYGFSADNRELLTELLDEKNRDLWNAVLYGVRAGDGADFVAVALSQVGNAGGKTYWSWYGFSSRVDWCACFVSWCADECGYVESGVLPRYAGCSTGVMWFRERGRWLEGTEEPAPGMVAFFDWDDPDGSNGAQDGVADHTGIVVGVSDGEVHTVEGNSGDMVRRKSYPAGWYEILGYGMPAY